MLFSRQQSKRAYRLIDAFLQPHPYLDCRQESIEAPSLADRDLYGASDGERPDPAAPWRQS